VSVYLDPMVNHGKVIGHAGPHWCHMIADDHAELYAMASAIGLAMRWAQTHTVPHHFDLGTDGMRARAIQAGAIECDRRTFVMHLRRIRASMPAVLP